MNVRRANPASTAASLAAIAPRHDQAVRESVDAACRLVAHGTALAQVVDAVWRNGYRTCLAEHALNTGLIQAGNPDTAELRCWVVDRQAAGVPQTCLLAEVWRSGYRSAHMTLDSHTRPDTDMARAA